MSNPVDRSKLWRVTPTASAARMISEIAEAEGRSISSTIQRLLMECVDRRNLDALLARAGLADAVRVLEQAAISRNVAPVFDKTVDIEPRAYRKRADTAAA
jgi:hypothetical protein